MSYYPIFIELEGKTVLVIGGGNIAERKIKAILQYGASIRLISKGLTKDINTLVKNGQIRHIGVEFNEKYLNGVFLVIAATDDRNLNHRISQMARKKSVLVNSVDQPSDCDFIVPSIVRRGDLLIAISTSGKSPALAKSIRKDLEKKYGEEYEGFLKLMGNLRKAILSKDIPGKDKSHIFKMLTNAGIPDSLARNDFRGIRNTLKDIFPEDQALVQNVMEDLMNE